MQDPITPRPMKEMASGAVVSVMTDVFNRFAVACQSV